MSDRQGQVDSLAHRAYRHLVDLLPRHDAREYGDAMLETFCRRRADASPGRRLLVTVRELAGLAGTVVRERLRGPTGAGGPAGDPAGRRRDSGRRGFRGGRWRTELTHAARRLRGAPGFTMAVVLTLAVAIGGNAAIFAVVDGILLQPLPYPAPDELVAVRHAAPGVGADDLELTLGLHRLYRERADGLAAIGAYEERAGNLTGGSEPLRVRILATTADLFTVLETPAALGRTLVDTDTLPGAPPVVILGHRLWQQRFGAAADVVGRVIRLDDVATEVVGVMPREFAFPEAEIDLWAPLLVDPSTVPPTSFSYDAVARLAPGVTPEVAEAELQERIHELPGTYANVGPEFLETSGLSPFLRPLKDQLIGDVRPTLAVLAGTVAFLLLVACANVANLFLARSDGRRHEVDVRACLGATPGDLARFHLAETTLLAGGGGALGLLLARLGLDGILRLAPPDLPRRLEIGIDLRVMAFAAALVLVAAVAFGLAPLRRLGRPARIASRQGDADAPGRSLVRQLLVVSQVALALVLLAGAGLMARSFQEMIAADPGFDSEGVLTFRISLPEARYPDREAVAAFQDELLAALGALPDVEAAGTARCLPLQGWCGGNPVASPDSPLPEEGFRQVVALKPVSRGYFEAVGMTLLAGRTFERADDMARAGAAVVSQPLARRLFPDATPGDVVGRRVYPSDGLTGHDWYTIVGVLAPVRRVQIDEPPAEILYVPSLGLPGDAYLPPLHDFVVAVRTAGGPLDLVEAARRTVWSLDGDLPVAAIRPLREIHADALARSALTMTLLGLAAGAAVLLGTVGVWGVAAWSVRRRRRELGVRMALGARPGDAVAAVLRSSLQALAVGTAVGLAGALVLGRALASVLYEVGPRDPATLAAVTALVLVVGGVAGWIPARRAARIDPVRTLGAD